MCDLSISQKFNMPMATPQFRSSNTNPINSTNKENKGLSTGVKVAIGTGLVALASYGIYVATRGKVKPKTTPPVTTNKSVIKDMAVDAFKQTGNKFERGKAKLANGEAYTGKLTQTLEDGKVLVREYDKGVLQKASKLDGENLVSSKSYFYDEKGMLTKITDDKNKDLYEAIIDKNVKIVTTQKSAIVTNIENGRLKRLQIEGKGDKWFYYDKDGKLKFVKHQYYDGGIRENFIVYHPDGKNVRFIRHGYESAEFFDINGNQVDKIRIDMARDGKSYYYDGMYKSEILELRQKDFKILDEKGRYKVWLSKTKCENFSDSTINISKNGKRYALSRNDKGEIEIFEHNGNEISQKTHEKLYNELVEDATKAYKEILTKHKKALRLKNEMQLADREYMRNLFASK